MTIRREDIEAKARQIQDAVSQTGQSMKDTAVLAAVAVVAMLGIAFMLGRRKGKKRRTVVEVYKI